MPMDSFIPNFNPTKLLHGEQYLKIKGPIPTSGTLINHVRLMEVLDKGKAASVTVAVETKDKGTGETVFENQSTVVLRGSGGFGGKKSGNGECGASSLPLYLFLNITTSFAQIEARRRP
jgi:multifunctional beta-oxidation protein